MTTDTVPAPTGGQGGATPAPPANSAAAMLTQDGTPSPVPATPPTDGAPPSGEDAPWWQSLGNEDLRGKVQNKGWKSPEDALNSYFALEKLRGVPAERLLSLPEDLNDAEAMAPVYQKLGLVAPEKPDDYGFASLEGSDPEFAKTAQEGFHKLGIPKQYAEPLAKWWNETIAAQTAAETQKWEEAAKTDMDALRQEWGGNYEPLMEQAKRAAKQFGFTAEEIGHMEAFTGAGSIYRRFAQIGEMIGESRFVQPDGGTKQSFTQTPESARATITQLMADKGFTEKLRDNRNPGHLEAKARWDNLHKLAYPEGGA